MFNMNTDSSAEDLSHKQAVHFMNQDVVKQKHGLFNSS